MNTQNTMNPQEGANILNRKQEAMMALNISQKAMRESMKENIEQGKSNAWGLPKKIQADVQKIIDGHTFQSVSWMEGKQGEVENEMKGVFQEFCQRYKKYTKSELSSEYAAAFYEAFVCNYESIRLYTRSNKIGNEKDISRIAQIWDEDFIAQYFSNDVMIARELRITMEEVRENFGRSVKLHFAVKNISDPMGALRRVKKHLEETLRDEAIMRELWISLEEVRENFGRSVKLHFAVGNISDPMNALRRVKKHLDETLNDEAIMKELWISLEEVRENFGRGVKLHFAVGNISDPMNALRRVKKHLEETLRDEAIMRELWISLEEVRENFGRSVKLHFAVKNISDPMGALRRVKKHLEETLRDEAIMRELWISLEEVRENFGRGVKLNFAVNNISDPMEGLKRVKKHLDETLSDEAIMRELGITLEEVQENLGRGVKLYFAVKNISDPMDGCRRWRQGKISTPWTYKH